MKRLITTAFAVLLMMVFSNTSLAHSHLDNSNPEDGEVVKKSLEEIVLEFDGTIEEGSFLEIETTSGESIKVKGILINGDTLTAKLDEPLANGEYEVEWNIVSTDGHTLDGDFEFTVDAPVTNNANNSELNDRTYDVEDNNNVEEEDGFNSTTLLVIVLLIVILVGGFFFIKRRK